MIRCEQLTKSYKDKMVLDHINLDIEENKIYGLIGRNGVGKTTLLSMMAAHIKATYGTITCDGQGVWENSKALANICFSRELSPVSLQGNFGNMTIKNYLKMASIYLPNWDQAMAERLVKDFELDIRKRMNKISKGMLSMVTIIVALASKAKYTFMDEPVAGLDIIARDMFYRLVLEEYTATGRTFIISTHILEEAGSIFEEVIILKDSRIFLKENTQDLLDRSFFVTGKADQVEEAVSGLHQYHCQNRGREKNVTVMLEDGQSIKKGYDVDVTPVTLQSLFVALCGKEV